MRWIAVIGAALLLAGAASADNGKQLFGRFCASCHGPSGGGSTGQRYGGSQARNQSVQTGLGPSLQQRMGAAVLDVEKHQGPAYAVLDVPPGRARGRSASA